LLNAHWEEAGGWMRPDFYPRAGESMRDAVTREVLATRQRVGIFDASPLGKIEVSGPDAAWFIDRFYANNMSNLEVGRSRYGLMLNENGVIIDDGTVARFGAEHYVITTTSGGANRIGGWLEEWRQCEWPDKTVFVTPVTTQWATIAIAGPNARNVLRKLETNINIDASAFPHLHVRAGRVCDVDARVYRVSFSGELGFEINVPARYGAALWSELLSLGSDFDITPYGLEALLLMRLEKGFLHIGTDTDGTTSPADVGWGAVASKKTANFIGKRSLSRGDNLRPDRLQLVGLIGGDIAVMTPGAHVQPADQKIGSDGWVTSAAFSPSLNQPIALAMLRAGQRRIGERVVLNDLGKTTIAQVTKPTFYDPKGARMHG
jgi:sarcosine oxidase subunit alpha